jgi:hypothetical protein
VEKRGTRKTTLGCLRRLEKKCREEVYNSTRLVLVTVHQTVACLHIYNCICSIEGGKKMGQCLGVDRLRHDIDRQKKELRNSVVEVEKLKKEITDLRTEIERSTKEISDNLDDWVLKSKKAEKERIIKEMENQNEISDASKDVVALRGDLRRLQNEFVQYKKDNTTILVALDKALEKRMSLQRVSSSDNVVAHPGNTEKLLHHHSYHPGGHHHHHHHHHTSNHEIGAKVNTDDIDLDFPLVQTNGSTYGEPTTLGPAEAKPKAAKTSGKSKFASAARAVQLQNRSVQNMIALNQEDIAANTSPSKVPQLNLATITGQQGAEESKNGSSNSNLNAEGPSLRKLYFTIAMTESGFGFVLRSLKSYQNAWFEPMDNGNKVTRMCVKDWRVFEDGKNPAELAGVRIGDVLEEVEGQTFGEVNDMLTALKDTASRKTVTIALWRRE